MAWLVLNIPTSGYSLFRLFQYASYFSFIYIIFITKDMCIFHEVGLTMVVPLLLIFNGAIT